MSGWGVDPTSELCDRAAYRDGGLVRVRQPSPWACWEAKGHQDRASLKFLWSMRWLSRGCGVEEWRSGLLFLSPACGFQLGTQGKSEPSLGQPGWGQVGGEADPDPRWEDWVEQSECRPEAQPG